MKHQGQLRIFRYQDKSGKDYLLTYVDGAFRFVHINPRNEHKLVEMVNKNGLPFLAYEGPYSITIKGNVYI